MNDIQQIEQREWQKARKYFSVDYRLHSLNIFRKRKYGEWLIIKKNVIEDEDDFQNIINWLNLLRKNHLKKDR